MTAGVYRIRNRVTGEVYVGSTINLYQRVRNHFQRLRARSHANDALQAAWDIAGSQAFSVGLLEVVSATNEALEEAETRWMERLRPLVSGFYNRLPPHQGRRRSLRHIASCWCGAERRASQGTEVQG